jgi:competence protein ComEA
MTRRELQGLAGVGAAALLGMGVWAAYPAWGVPNPAAEIGWTGRLDAARRVDINQAGVAQLEALPGIGPVLAQRIVEERRRHGTFLSVDDLARVQGIGTKRAQALGAYVSVE